MAASKPMLDNVELQQVQTIETGADQALAPHGVPALEGDFLQRLDRRAGEIRLTGLLSGAEVGQGLKTLREKFHAAEPVPFVSDIITATKVDEVLIKEMSVREVAGKPERFEYAFTLREYIPAQEVTTEDPPPDPDPPPRPDNPIDQNVGTLVVEVIVEGRPNFDFSQVTLTVQGTTQEGEALSRSLTNRQGNIWTEENVPAGQGEYTASAVVTGPPAMSGSATAAVQAGQTTRVMITLRPGSLIAKAFVVHFAMDRAFVHPCMRLVLRQVAQHARAHSNEKMVIVGHTDKVGSDAYNQSLSERRARIIFAALTYGHNPAAAVAEWDQIRRQRSAGQMPTIHEGRGGWGTPEYQYMLQDLGYYRGPVDNRHETLTDAAVRAFQKDRGLQVDGVVGDQTWPVLIDAYLAQDSLAVANNQLLPNAKNGCDGGRLKWLGCGEQMPLPGTPSSPCAPDTAWRPNRRVEILFVQAAGLPCEVPKPATFELPPSSPVGSTWCLGPGDPQARCCFITRNPQERNKWLVQAAEPGSVTVRGSIRFEDGTPSANTEYALIAPDGEYMDGERHCGSDRGRAVPGVTAADGSFAYPNKPKGIGIYTLEINGQYLARLAGEPPEAAKGNVVCKRLDGRTPFDIVVVRHPGDPSSSGPFSVGEDDYDEGDFIIPSQYINRRVAVKIRALVRYPAQQAGRRRPVATNQSSYPLAVIGHGNHRFAYNNGTPIHNYRGLEYLARHLASRGYIAISIDLNDITRHGLNETHRAVTFLKHIEVMADKNTNHPRLAGKIDMDSIALVGHSRSGEGVVTAQHLNETENRGHQIKAIISIAPTDGNVANSSVPFLVFNGSADSDVGADSPAALYGRATSRKSMLYIYGAIHNFYNTHPDWVRPRGSEFGERDIARQDSRVLQPRRHLDIARGYTLAFLELHLRNQTAYSAYFNQYLRPPNLANIEIHQQFRMPQGLKVDDFEQRPFFFPDNQSVHTDDPRNSLGFRIDFSTLVFYEEWFQSTNDTHAGFMKWDTRDGSVIHYQTLLGVTSGSGARSQDVSNFGVLSFRVSLAANRKKRLEAGAQGRNLRLSEFFNPPNRPQDFFVTLADLNNNRASVRLGVITSLPYPYIHHEDLQRNEFQNTELVFKTFRIPLALFQARNPNLDLGQLKTIVFEFRQTPFGEIVTDTIEFSQ